MAGGRPRTVSLEPHDMIALGEEMVEWCKMHDPLHISEWYCIEKGLLHSTWETMVKRPEFVGYYETAKAIIGRKYLDKQSNIREGVSQRWQRVYFKELKDEEDAKLREDLERAKELETHKAKLRAESDQSIVSDAVKELSNEIRRRNHITNPED